MLLPGLNLRRFALAGLVLLAAGCTVILAAGCASRDQITSYTVRKPELIDPTLAAAAAAAEPKPTQTLGAIVVLENAGWFFKVTGDPAQVEPQREAFLNFVKSVRFTTGPAPQPTWDLPTDWVAQPGNEFRFATLQMPAGERTLDLAISELPRDKETPVEDFVLVNINRWLGQVSLPPIAVADLAKETETFKIGDHDCTFVSLVGESAGGGMGGAPFAPFASGATAAPGSSPNVPVRPSAKSSAAGGELVYDTPEGWKVGKSTGISSVALVVTDGDKKVDITVTPLRPSDLLENVNRWRGQVKLPPVKAADLPALVKKVDALGVKADYVELVGPEATILGVSANVGDKIWFIKLSGDNELAALENARFQEFVKSLKLK